MGTIKEQKLYWTEHVKAKMRQYGLSPSRVKRVLRFPSRLEEGIAPRTLAGMQKAGSKKHPYEIWVMYQTKRKKKGRFDLNKEITIISAWRYPGQSPVNAPPPIPEDVWEIIRKEKGGRGFK